jgi:hypothetical protein
MKAFTLSWTLASAILSKLSEARQRSRLYFRLRGSRAIDDCCGQISSGSRRLLNFSLMEMHSLGVTAPIDQQFRINVVACIKTVIQTLPGPYINDFEFMRLSPSQKKSFKSLAESWGPTISNQIAARLPQKENAA